MSQTTRPALALRVFITTALVGIALAVSDPGLLAPVVTLGSLLAVVYALHRLGRSGPDGPWTPEGP